MRYSGVSCAAMFGYKLIQYSTVQYTVTYVLLLVRNHSAAYRRARASVRTLTQSSTQGLRGRTQHVRTKYVVYGIQKYDLVRTTTVQYSTAMRVQREMMHGAVLSWCSTALCCSTTQELHATSSAAQKVCAVVSRILYVCTAATSNPNLDPQCPPQRYLHRVPCAMIVPSSLSLPSILSRKSTVRYGIICDRVSALLGTVQYSACGVQH